MSTGKFTSFTEDPAKKEAGRNHLFRIRLVFVMSRLVPQIFIFWLLAVSSVAQNPPDNGDPYVSRGHPTSPNGKYGWYVRINYPIRYELIERSDGKVLATVKAYYPEVENSNTQYARAVGVYWNWDGTIVALDEFNCGGRGGFTSSSCGTETYVKCHRRVLFRSRDPWLKAVRWLIRVGLPERRFGSGSL